jgi:hypothetical protein
MTDNRTIRAAILNRLAVVHDEPGPDLAYTVAQQTGAGVDEVTATFWELQEEKLVDEDETGRAYGIADDQDAFIEEQRASDPDFRAAYDRLRGSDGAGH